MTVPAEAVRAAIEVATAAHLNKERLVEAMLAAALPYLTSQRATARTRPTRHQVIRALFGERDPWEDLTEKERRQADAVLALLADQPTEAEAGARALVHAAGDHFHAMVTAGAGNPSEASTWLRERAARLRGGAR